MTTTTLSIKVGQELVGELTLAQAQAFTKGLQAGTVPVLVVWHNPRAKSQLVQIYASALEALTQWVITATNRDTLPGDRVCVWQWVGAHWSPVSGDHAQVEVQGIPLYH